MKTAIMCAVMSLAVLLLSATANSVDRVKLVPVGSSMIAVPVPKGFEERKIDREEEALRQRLSQNRVRFLASFSQNDEKQIDITVAPESEQLMVSPSQFDRIAKGPVKTQYLELLNKLEHELNISVNELLSDSHRDVLKSVRQKKISHVPLGLIRDDSYSLSFADIGFIESKGNDPSDVAMLASTNTMMLVSGKVLNVTMLAPYQGKKTLAWVKSASLQLIDDIHEANKNVLYATVGADTLRLTIPDGFSVSETPEEIVRYLKREGSRVLASLEGEDPRLFKTRVDIMYGVAEGGEREPFTFTMEEFQQIQANVKRNWKPIQEDVRKNFDSKLPSKGFYFAKNKL